MPFANVVRTSPFARTLRLTLGATLLAAATLQTGCGTGAISSPSRIAGPMLQGKIFGGQQPVTGSKIQLYAAGSGGYGTPAVPLIASTVTSGSDGSFSITGTYTCSPGQLVYLAATGGNSGFSNNPNLAMIAALGPCSGLSPSTFITINEVTTVASVWALSPFMTGLANIAAPTSNTVGLTNAFADVNTLVDTSTGFIPGPTLPSGASVPTSEMNTLADILAACINSAGGTAGSNNTCGKLFTAANPGGTSGTAPTDTVTAAMNIAQHPGLNVANLYAVAPPASPFQPTLASAPADFTIAVRFTGGGLSAPSALAADASGQVWVTNSTANTVTEFAHDGTVMSGAGFTGALNQPSAIAIDSVGAAWVANKGNNTVTRLLASGSTAPGSPFSGGGLNLPASIALDAAGNVWIANSGNASMTELSSTGSAISPSAGYTGASITTPIGVAVSPH